MYGILVDVTRCTGCERCVEACVKANDLNATQAQIDRMRIADGLSANRLTTIIKLPGGQYVRKSCMHCLEPSCVSACLVGGITKAKTDRSYTIPINVSAAVTACWPALSIYPAMNGTARILIWSNA